MIEIKITDLIIPMFLGIYDYEKTLKRNVIFNLKLNCEIKIKDKNNIKNLINYDLIIQSLTSHFTNKYYGLIEDVISEAINILKAYKQIQDGEITITKTNTHNNVESISVSTKWSG